MMHYLILDEVIPQTKHLLNGHLKNIEETEQKIESWNSKTHRNKKAHKLANPSMPTSQTQCSLLPDLPEFVNPSCLLLQFQHPKMSSKKV